MPKYQKALGRVQLATEEKPEDRSFSTREISENAVR